MGSSHQEIEIGGKIEIECGICAGEPMSVA